MTGSRWLANAYTSVFIIKRCLHMKHAACYEYWQLLPILIVIKIMHEDVQCQITLGMPKRQISADRYPEHLQSKIICASLDA